MTEREYRRPARVYIGLRYHSNDSGIQINPVREYSNHETSIQSIRVLEFFNRLKYSSLNGDQKRGGGRGISAQGGGGGGGGGRGVGGGV